MYVHYLFSVRNMFFSDSQCVRCKSSRITFVLILSRKESTMPDAAPTADIQKTKERLMDVIRAKSLHTQGGPFKLASGAISDYYIDMKPTIFSPEGLNLIADLIFEHLRDDKDVDSIGGLELGAVPIVAAVSMRS